MDYKVNKLKEEEQAYDLKQQHNYNPLLNNKGPGDPSSSSRSVTTR